MIAMIGLAVVSCEVYFASIFLICFALAFKYQTFSSNVFTLFLLIHFFLLLFIVDSLLVPAFWSTTTTLLANMRAFSLPLVNK